MEKNEKYLSVFQNEKRNVVISFEIFFLLSMVRNHKLHNVLGRTVCLADEGR